MNLKLLWMALVIAIAVGGGFLLYSQWKAQEVAPVATTPAPIAVKVYKSPTCGCCGEYERYLEANGFSVISVKTEDMTEIKIRYGVPQNMMSCHTAVVEGYFIEGHVPVEAIRALLERRPNVEGIALPGMPHGSPGMGGVKSHPFQIYAIVGGELQPFITL
jgi:hypothetical protein